MTIGFRVVLASLIIDIAASAVDAESTTSATSFPVGSWQDNLLNMQRIATTAALGNIKYPMKVSPGLSNPVFVSEDSESDWIIDPTSRCAVNQGVQGTFISTAWSGACDERGVAIGAGVLRAVRYDKDGDIENIIWENRYNDGGWHLFFLVHPSATYDPARPYCVGLRKKSSHEQKSVTLADPIPLEVEAFFQSLRPTARFNCVSEEAKHQWAQYVNRNIVGEYTKSGKPRTGIQEKQGEEASKSSETAWFTDQEKKDMRKFIFDVIKGVGGIVEEKAANERVKNAADAYDRHRSQGMKAPNTMEHFDKGANLLNEKYKAESDLKKIRTRNTEAGKYEALNREISGAVKSSGEEAPAGGRCLAKYEEVVMDRETQKLLERDREVDQRVINLCRDVRIEVFSCYYRATDAGASPGRCDKKSDETIDYEQIHKYHIDPAFRTSDNEFAAEAFCPQGSQPTAFAGHAYTQINGRAKYECICFYG